MCAYVNNTINHKITHSFCVFDDDHVIESICSQMDIFCCYIEDDDDNDDNITV